MTMEVKMAVNSSASFKSGEVMSFEDSPLSWISSSQKTVSSASSWTIDSLEINSALERPRWEER